MNRVVLMGRLTRDPDVRYSQGENSMAIARYTLAVDRRRRTDQNEQQADFISCVAFGKGGEFAEKYLKKGTKIVVSGRIQTGSYENKGGQRVYTTDVVVEDQEFAESKKDNSGRDAMDDQNAAQYAQHSTGSSAAAGGAMGYNNGSSGSGQRGQYTGFMNIPDGIDEELPFN